MKKAILFKTGEDYLLRDMNGDTLGITNGTINGRKLSKENCDEIFGVVDVEKLAEERFLGSDDITNYNLRFGFKEGFNKAMELNKDKVFTIEAIKKAIHFGVSNREYLLNGTTKVNELFKTLQQPTEIDVEVEYMFSVEENGESTNTGITKLDENGNLILRKITS